MEVLLLSKGLTDQHTQKPIYGTGFWEKKELYCEVDQ